MVNKDYSNELGLSLMICSPSWESLLFLFIKVDVRFIEGLDLLSRDEETVITSYYLLVIFEGFWKLLEVTFLGPEERALNPADDVLNGL